MLSKAKSSFGSDVRHGSTWDIIQDHWNWTCVSDCFVMCDNSCLSWLVIIGTDRKDGGDAAEICGRDIAQYRHGVVSPHTIYNRHAFGIIF